MTRHCKGVRWTDEGLVHDGVGIWFAAKQLSQGELHWPGIRSESEVELDNGQLQALVQRFAKLWLPSGLGGCVACVNPIAGTDQCDAGLSRHA